MDLAAKDPLLVDSRSIGRKYAMSGAVGFALVFPTLIAWFYFVLLARPATELQANPALQLIYSSGKILQFAFPVLCVLAFERRWPRPAAPTFRGLAFGLGFGLLVGGGILGLYFGVLRGTSLVRQTPAMLQAKLHEFDLATPAGFILLAAFLSVVHSLLEEYYWRWFVFGYLQRLLPLAAALVVSGLGFMGHHVVVLAVYFPGRFFTMALPLSLCIAVGGIVWAWLYHHTGSIYAPWLSHLLIDAAIMTVGYDLMFVHS